MLVQTEKVADPHPFLAIWLLCRRYQGEGSVRVLPEVGSVLDQDYETMWAFEVIDELYSTENQLQQNLKDQAKNHEALLRQLTT